jgi:hypothetical protein
MRRILRLLSEHSVQATFFVLGWVADRHPDLVKAIAAYVRGALALSLPLLCQYQQDGKPQVHY